MYQGNANQRNKTNLILVSFFLSRSSSKPGPKRSQSVRPENLKWTICIQNLKSRERTKVKIGKQPRAEKPLVTLRMKSTHELQISTPSLQQIFTVKKTVMQIILENGIELLEHLIRQ